jgi:hypothetical protein
VFIVLGRSVAEAASRVPPVIHHEHCKKYIAVATVSPSGVGLAVAEVLSIAHQDAQKVYSDLSGFRITLTPCPDGWHVDYDLTDPLVAGGGPYYVIHPDTGNILVRRFEQ